MTTDMTTENIELNPGQSFSVLTPKGLMVEIKRYKIPKTTGEVNVSTHGHTITGDLNGMISQTCFHYSGFVTVQKYGSFISIVGKNGKEIITVW